MLLTLFNSINKIMAFITRNLVFKILLMLLVQCMSAEDGQVSELSQLFKKRFIEATNKCAAKINVQPVNILQLLSEEDPPSIPITEETKCYLLCIFQELHMMDEQANYLTDDIQDLLKLLPSSKFVKIFKEHLPQCLQEDSKYHCEKAFKFARCFYDRKQNMGFKKDRSRLPEDL